MKIEYVVRRARGGRTWAVDKIDRLSNYYHIVSNTQYFKTEEEAEAFKKRKENSK